MRPARHGRSSEPNAGPAALSTCFRPFRALVCKLVCYDYRREARYTIEPMCGPALAYHSSKMSHDGFAL
jgi:hypothetical protein